jgi:tRNA U38,U39,U40 pseudouridine synthase TruA
MPSIYEHLTLTTEIEQDFEHDPKVLPLFSTPKIYTAKEDLSKRWYVYYYFRNPKTGKLERMANVYGKVNHYKTKESRMSLLSSYRKNLVLLLKQGFNPFIEITELNKESETHIIKKKIKESSKKEDMISTNKRCQ